MNTIDIADLLRDLPPAAYAWPDTDDITVESYGAGSTSGPTDGPTIAVGILPHSNEPLGYALRPQLAGYRGELGRIVLLHPIDPPPPSGRFPLPCDIVTFFRQGYLQPLPEQVEFAHRRDPRTPAQHRAARFRDLLAGTAPDAIVLVHNDFFAESPYLYVNQPWPEVERHLVEDLADAFPQGELDQADWTWTVGPRSYAYFPGQRIGLWSTHSAGFCIAYHLGVPVFTVEVPMFDWSAAPEQRLPLREAMERWIARGAGDSSGLVRQARDRLGDRIVPMIPAEHAARVLWAAIQGAGEQLTQWYAPSDLPARVPSSGSSLATAGTEGVRTRT